MAAIADGPVPASTILVIETDAASDRETDSESHAQAHGEADAAPDEPATRMLPRVQHGEGLWRFVHLAKLYLPRRPGLRLQRMSGRVRGREPRRLAHDGTVHQPRRASSPPSWDRRSGAIR